MGFGVTWSHEEGLEILVHVHQWMFILSVVIYPFPLQLCFSDKRAAICLVLSKVGQGRIVDLQGRVSYRHNQMKSIKIL